MAIFTIASWLLGLVKDLGLASSDLEAKANEFKEKYPDLGEAGSAWLNWWVPQVRDQLGDERTAIATGQRIWKDFTGVTPGYDPNAFFGA